MKRVRGPDEIAPPSASTSKHTGSGGAGSSGGGGNSGSSVTGAGGGNIDYHSSSGIPVSAQVRSVPPPKDMPSSIQFSQSQQHYPGAIVVPTAAASPIKGGSTTSNLTSSTCAASSMTSSVTLHSAGMVGTGNHVGPQAPMPTSQAQAHVQQPSAIRHKTVQAPTPPVNNLSGSASNAQQFQRLKVEDALSYLDEVKLIFSDQPQVYNDFLDIMKEFKSQSIDTPGVITRVSHLFKGHPRLIIGFNTFLPPGYKIEVQANEMGFAYQVSVSMPSPTATHTATLSQHHCTVNVGSPPISSPPTQPAKAQPVVQIMPGSGNIHHSMPNNISSNNLNIHGPPSPPVQPYNNSHITQAQVSQAVSQALSQAQDGVPSTGQTQQNQPVEFNHAINYVNKIKHRFQDQPEKYKRFLEILHTYQKEQRTLKESSHMDGSGTGGPTSSSGKHLTEAEVYSQVAKLFEHQEDLLQEFGQFLPDATNQQSALSAMFQQTNKVGTVNDHSTIVKKPIGIKATYNNSGVLPREHREMTGPSNLERDNRDHRDRERERAGIREMGNAGQKFGHSTGQLKRSPSFTSSMATGNSHVPHGPPPPKKHKVALVRDISIAEAGKHGTLNDYAFFDKVRKALRSQEVYESFLRCLTIFNQEIISKAELLSLVTPFLGRFPELLRWFKEFLGCTSESASSATPGSLSQGGPGCVGNVSIEALPNNVVRSHQDRPQGDLAMEIDYSTCKRLGASYCALPKTYIQPKCTGRTQLCKEVLNDTWVSFPTWSEDSTFVTSRKTQYEEFIYRCEDERFELDGVIETNAATIRVLEGVHKKMGRMSQEELQKFKLDDCLGGCSPTIHQRALRRIYGDKAPDIIDGLKKNPMIAVPVVLRRLKSKEEEWREAQKGFNKIWREQNEKYYLKSLDHQGINFKQNDQKAIRSKNLFNEIELLYDERQADENNENQDSPHLILTYPDKSALDDAANLLIHHVKRQTAIHKEDKQKIKALLKHFIPDMFFHPRQELSDDEQDEEKDKDEINPASCGNNQTSASTTPPLNSGLQGNRNSKTHSPSPSFSVKAEPDLKVPLHMISADPEEAYTLFIGSSHWYLFMRLHQILCERLTKMYNRAMILAEEESRYKQQRKDSTAVALRLKPKGDIEVEDYYPAFLDMVKNVLDGNMESSTYEDTLREMFGIHAYIAFTLDKVVSNAVRQLQHLVSDPTCVHCMEQFQREQKQPKESCGVGGLCHTAYMRIANEMAYQRRVEKKSTDENYFKIYIYKKNCKITIELLDSEGEETTESRDRDRDREREVLATEKWTSYVERYSSNTGQTSPKEEPPSADNEPTTNLPVSNDQAAKGGRGRKRKTDINKKSRPRPFEDHGAIGCTTTASTSTTITTTTTTTTNIDGNGWNSVDKVMAGRKRVYLHRNVRQYRKHVAEKMRVLSPNATSSEKTTNPDAKKSFDVGAEATDGSDVAMSDEMQCTFNLNNYRAVYVVNQEAILYKKDCFKKARKSHPSVTKRINSKFQQWHSKWVNKNVVDAQHRLCQDWLMGRYENLIPHKTRVVTNNDQTRTPYRQYNKYCVDNLKSGEQQGQTEQQQRKPNE